MEPQPTASLAPQLDAFPEARVVPADTDERYTPWPLFRELDREFGFTLDVCATPESAKVRRFFTKQDNGLERSWAGERVWCNPPFSEIEPWVRKAWTEPTELAVMLLPVWTDRRWWQHHVEPYRDSRTPRVDAWLATRFLPGRVRFGHPGNPDGVGVDQPNFWCCLLIWDRRPR